MQMRTITMSSTRKTTMMQRLRRCLMVNSLSSGLRFQQLALPIIPDKGES